MVKENIKTALLIVAVFAFTLQYGFKHAPVVEGIISPVVGEMEVLDIHAYADGYTYFSGRAPKLRDCKWRRTTWYLGVRDGNNVPAIFEHLDKPQIRSVGELYWETMRVNLTPNELLSNSFGDVAHQCGGWWRFWLTLTRFYN